MVLVRGTALVVAMTLGAGCSVGRGPLMVGSDDPAVNVPAMVNAGQERDRDKLKKLVPELESSDPAIRMFALSSLAELTGGETFGFKFYEPQPVRMVAVAKWREYAGLPPSKATLRAAAKSGLTTAPATTRGGGGADK